jgi:hypothetical protein
MAYITKFCPTVGACALRLEYYFANLLVYRTAQLYCPLCTFARNLLHILDIVRSGKIGT